jgi:4-amino-4-deoxy-L-arabinose transferase-like glycosyltransferase
MEAESTRESRQGLAIALALATALVAVNLATSHELAPSDQGKQAQYALDLFLHGNWLVPGDLAIGEAATKPPLYTWLTGILAVLLGRIEEWILRVPAALSALGLVAVVYETGRRLAGARVALAAAILFATTHHFTKIAVLARTDGLLAFLLALQILVYLRCRETGRETLGRVVLLCALSIAAWFTKGPAGGLAALVILVHLLWMREASSCSRAFRSPRSLPPSASAGASAGCSPRCWPRAASSRSWCSAWRVRRASCRANGTRA